MITLDDEALEEMKHECVSYCRELFAINDIDVNRVLGTILEDPIRRIKAGSFSAETFKLVEMDLIIVHEQDIAEAIARSASLWRTRQWN